MTTTLSATAEDLLREQVGKGKFPSVDAAVEAAVQAAFAPRASEALEMKLDAALQHSGRRVPLQELQRHQK